MRKIFIYILAFILFTFLGGQSLDMAIARQIENTAPYCLSFASIGAIFLESRLDAWAKINATLTEQCINSYLNGIGGVLNLPENAVRVVDGNGSQKGVQWRDGPVEYKISLTADPSGQTIATVAIKSTDGSINLIKYKSLLDNVKDCSWTYNFTYSGEIGAVFNQESMEILADTALKNMNAEAFETFRKGDSISFRAWSSRLPGGLREKNVEFAIHKQQDYGKTEVWLGIPGLIHSY